MTNLIQHHLFENGQEHELPLKEGRALIVTTTHTDPESQMVKPLRKIAIADSQLQGKAVRVGHFKDASGRSARINLADVEKMGKNDLEGHQLRLKLSPDGSQLHIENMSGNPMSVAQFPDHRDSGPLHIESFGRGTRILQPGENIEFGGLSGNVRHLFEWVNVEGYTPEKNLVEKILTIFKHENPG
ncbi:hypothetical protein HY994_05495 [Candidatus Micrarchaeota archaeon]|nr:hypothetical protein [Candidatus Micrarchaeota archaeon]